MQRFLTILFSCIVVLHISAQQGLGGKVRGLNVYLKKTEEVPTFRLPAPDIVALRKEDSIHDALKLGPWRFGYNYSTDLDLNNAGTWFTMPNGDKIWLLKIQLKGATTINLTFKNSSIPQGNELFVINEDGSFVLGKFTSSHIYEGELGCEIIKGNTAIVSYYVPFENRNNIGTINLATVTYGYRTAEEFANKAFGSSDDCEMNVNCPDGVPYANQRNSVVMIMVGSNGFCTGAVVNNTLFDGKPYVLTANHCYNYNSNLASWIFRFNWQAPGCTNPSVSPPFESLSGSVLRARRDASDFCLVEITGGLINGKIPPICTPYFAGWNHQNASPTSTFCIHHPKGDIKKISFDDDAPVPADYPNSTHEFQNSWMVIWDRNTTTESASSGSPLFNENGLIIGQLWGGNALCSNSGTGQDYYGRLHNSWEPSGSNASNQLKYWLDPDSSDIISITGYDPYNDSTLYNVSAIGFTNLSSNVCAREYEPMLIIQNAGLDTLTSLEIHYQYNGSPTNVFQWSGSLGQYETDTLGMPMVEIENGNNTVTVDLQMPNGMPDEDNLDNQVTAQFEGFANGVQLQFEFYLGCYADEVSWELNNSAGATIYEGGNYPGPSNTNYLVSESFCLTNDCYELILNDDFGDGVEGAIHSTCDYSGSMQLTHSNTGEVIAELPIEEANFGSSITFEFCIDNAFEGNWDTSFKLYPNPANDWITIETPSDISTTVEMHNVLGQQVKSMQMNQSKLKIPVSNLSSGVYFVTLKIDKERITQKLVLY